MQPIFKFLQKYGNIDNEEMYKTFNMGMGFAIITHEKDVEETIKILKIQDHGEVKIVGRIEKGRGVSVPTLGLNY